MYNEEVATEAVSYCPSFIESRKVKKDTGFGKLKLDHHEDNISQASTTKYKQTENSFNENLNFERRSIQLILNQNNHKSQNDQDEYQSEPS